MELLNVMVIVIVVIGGMNHRKVRVRNENESLWNVR